MHKLGQPISPLEVIANGSHSLHAVGDDGISVLTADGRARLRIRWAGGCVQYVCMCMPRVAHATK